MARTKQKRRARTKVKTKGRRKVTGKGPKVLDAAAEAMMELGQGAKDLKSSWEHLQRAQAKGTPATKALARAGKKATRTVRRATRATVKNTKRAFGR